MLTADELKSVIVYDPETGGFERKGRRHGRGASRIGNVRPDGYLLIRVNSKRYYAHRLAWLYMTGEEPPDFIDHVDGNPSNNAWGNLRPATPQLSSYNRGIQSNNSLGYKGVKKTTSGKFAAGIQANKKYIYLGSFSDIREAAEAYLFAALELHGDYARV